MSSTCISLCFPFTTRAFPHCQLFQLSLSLLFCGPSASRRPRWTKKNPARNVARRDRPRFFAAREEPAPSISVTSTSFFGSWGKCRFTQCELHTVKVKRVSLVSESFWRGKKQEGGWREKGQSRDRRAVRDPSLPSEGRAIFCRQLIK